ncbi:MAG: hypothetical protein H6734_27460 [Alphaproteobacteria bacterium]|nr:hypothetical protein [Alphaproteobacteria bacterium]MCB9688157.1 hypothetical protein [Alphaproteobacteria bacterium]
MERPERADAIDVAWTLAEDALETGDARAAARLFERADALAEARDTVSLGRDLELARVRARLSGRLVHVHVLSRSFAEASRHAARAVGFWERVVAVDAAGKEPLACAIREWSRARRGEGDLLAASTLLRRAIATMEEATSDGWSPGTLLPHWRVELASMVGDEAGSGLASSATQPAPPPWVLLPDDLTTEDGDG